jgi:DNA-binding response OmpR family regulator
LKAFEECDPALVILDVMMPGLDGISVCTQLREVSDIPIIILTALEDESDAARALERGADDYIRKPFGASELVARVRTVLRRANSGVSKPERLEAGPIVVDENERLVLVDGEEVILSRTEFALLTFMIRNRNRVLTHDQILERVWGSEYVGSHHVLRVAMSRLRLKLEAAGAALIETLLGVGYRLKAS